MKSILSRMPKPWWLSSLREIFSFDLRSLAIFRIAFGSLCLVDVWTRGMDLVAHYTDYGVMPRGPLIEHYLPPMRFSFHLLSGDANLMAVLFLAHLVVLVMFLVGYRTKLASFLSWFFLISLHARNPYVLQGGDVFIRMVAFIAMFLPLAQHHSVDRMRGVLNRSTSEKTSDVATLFYVFQVSFVYWFTAVHKLSEASFPVWWMESKAVYHALNADQFTQPLGYFLLSLPYPALEAMTRYVILLELLAPFCFIMPIFHKAFRWIGILLIATLHLGLGSSLALGPFPFIGCISMIPLIPGGFWTGLLRKIGLSFLLEEEPLKEKPDKKNLLEGVLRFLRSFFLLWTLFYIVLWNCYEVKWIKKVAYQWGLYANLLSIDQRWDMFSPPLTDDGWYVIPGKLRSGKEVNLFDGGKPVTWEKPNPVRDTYKNQRWRKYMMNLWLKRNADIRLYYGQFLCKEWNRAASEAEQLETFEIYFHREDTKDYGEPPELTKVLLWEHWCFDKPEETSGSDERTFDAEASGGLSAYEIRQKAREAKRLRMEARAKAREAERNKKES